MSNTSTTVLRLQKLCPSLSMAQKLAIAELARQTNATLDFIVANASHGLEAVADVQIDVQHRSFMTQKPLHGTDCLVCGSLTAKVGV